MKEFLPDLNPRQKWFREQANAKIGDMVLFVDDMQHRSKCRLGRIVHVYPDKKGRVRTVFVRTKNGTYKRPIAKLLILKIWLIRIHNLLIQKSS